MKSNSCIFLSNLFIIFLISLLILSFSCDAAENYQMTIQDSALICLYRLVYYYILIMVEFVLVLAVIFFLIATLITNANYCNNSNTYFSHSKNLNLIIFSKNP